MVGLGVGVEVGFDVGVDSDDMNCLITIATYPNSRFFGGVVNSPESNETREPLLGLAIIGDRDQSF